MPTRRARLVSEPEERAYLASPVPIQALPLLLFAVASHSWSLRGEPLFPVVACGVLLVAVAWLLNAPRWVIHGALFLLVLQTTYDRVFVNAAGIHDGASYRDECAEYAAREFLAGRDPWLDPPPELRDLTTGYADVLLLSPFVALFDRIDEAAMAFWTAMLIALLIADLRLRNGTFVPLSLAYLAGVLDLFHTQNWALDELYFPFVLLIAAFLLARRGHLVLSGGLLALCALWRSSYFFPCLGFVVWLLAWAPRTLGRLSLLGRLGLGILLGTVMVVGPFVARWGLASLTRGPLGMAADYAAGEGPVIGLAAAFPWEPEAARLAAAALRTLLAAVAIWYLGRKVGTLAPHHPFWHVCVGAWMAHTLVWHTAEFRDYQLMVVIPAFLAIALRERDPRQDAAAGA